MSNGAPAVQREWWFIQLTLFIWAWGSLEAVKDFTSKGIPVIRTARQGAGDIWVNPPSMGDLSDEASQTVAGRELTPAKARILLMLALQTPRSRAELQTLFDRYGSGGR